MNECSCLQDELQDKSSCLCQRKKTSLVGIKEEKENTSALDLNCSKEKVSWTKSLRNHSFPKRKQVTYCESQAWNLCTWSNFHRLLSRPGGRGKKNAAAQSVGQQWHPVANSINQLHSHVSTINTENFNSMYLVSQQIFTGKLEHTRCYAGHRITPFEPTDFPAKTNP